MPRKMNTEEFIAKAKAIHGNKYDYSKTEYTGSKNKVVIICREHGEFEQRADQHLLGQNCPKCSPRALKTKEDFIRDAIKVHGNKYGYDSVIYKGSYENVEILCPIHGYFHQKPYNHLAGKGCPQCGYESSSIKQSKRQCGLLVDVHPEIAAMFLNPDEAKFVTASSKHKYKMKCENGHIWEVSPYNILRGRGCPYCSHKKAYSGETDLYTVNEELAKQMVDSELSHNILPYSNKKVEWQCELGHKWFASPASRMNGYGCPVCSNHKVVAGVNDLKTTHPDIAAMLVDQNLASQLTFGSNKYVDWCCPEGHIWNAQPNDVVRGHGCAVCNGMQINVGINDLWTTHSEKALELVNPDDGYKATCGSRKKLLWRCQNNSDHVYEQSVRNHVLHNQGCPICWGEGLASDKEKELSDFVSLIVEGDVCRHDRKLLCGQELDVYIPEKSLAIEFNGCYWHTDEQKPPNYHRNKFYECEKQGVQLISVWEDDWNYRQDVVKHMIVAKLGCLDKLWDEDVPFHVGARQCSIQVIDGHTAGDFLDENHIQGRVTATIHFGLFDKDNILRAVLSVRSPRNNARMKRGKGEWEVQRYATYGSIPGGFTKLLKYAEKYIKSQGMELNRWVSFSANDVSNGAMYKKSGFELADELFADYKYVGKYTGWMRRPKERFQKKNFRNSQELKYVEGLTERELASLNNLYRVYDSGKRKWVKEVE